MDGGETPVDKRSLSTPFSLQMKIVSSTRIIPSILFCRGKERDGALPFEEHTSLSSPKRTLSFPHLGGIVLLVPSPFS